MSKYLLVKNVDINLLKKKKIKESSFKTYKAAYNSLCKNYGDYKLSAIIKIKDDMVKKGLTKTTIRNWLMIVYFLYKLIFGEDHKSDKISLFLDKLIIDIKKSPNRNDCSEEYIKEYKMVKDRIKNDISNEDIKAVDIITMYIYTNISARRGDLRFLRIYKDKPDNDNNPYINLGRGVLFFPPYKVNRPVYINILSHVALLDRLRKVQVNHHRLYKDSFSRKGDYRQTHNSQKAFSVYIKKIFKKYYKFDTNIQKIRRLSSCVDLSPELRKSLDKIKTKAYLQSHSIGTHITDYLKI